MATIYILYSHSIDKHYIGSCLDIDERLNEHNAHFHTIAFTKRANDWEIYYQYNTIEKEMARKIELHIKKMKSKIYLQNLKRYPEIMEKLIARFSAGSYR